jgi:hypothetical protein
MASGAKQKIFPHLWYAKEAEEAARFYASIFPDSRVDHVTPLMAESPSGPPGSVKVVDFTLFGQRFQAMSAGPHHDFNERSPSSFSATIGRSWIGTGTRSSREAARSRRAGGWAIGSACDGRSSPPHGGRARVPSSLVLVGQIQEQARGYRFR